MRSNRVILQHGAEFITDLLVNQGNNLWMGDHAKNLFPPRPIAIDFLATGRHVAMRPEHLGYWLLIIRIARLSVLRVAANLKCGLDSAGDTANRGSDAEEK